MKRMLVAVVLVAAMNAVVTISPIRAEDRPSGGTVEKAKIGDSITCAIDGMKMPLQADTPSLEYQGKVYYFCGEPEKQTFLKDPERYTKLRQ